jgi:hypothetical protein
MTVFDALLGLGINKYKFNSKNTSTVLQAYDRNTRSPFHIRIGFLPILSVIGPTNIITGIETPYSDF